MFSCLSPCLFDAERVSFLSFQKMSDDSSFPLSTSLTSPILSVSCSFINFDGIVLTMKESTRHSLRQLKRRVYKKLTDLDASEVESSSTASTPEDVICVSSSPSIASSQSVKSTSIHIDGRMCVILIMQKGPPLKSTISSSSFWIIRVAF